MNIDIIFKIAAIGILVAVVNQVLLRAGREEIAMLTTLTGVIVVLLMVVNLINDLFNSVRAAYTRAILENLEKVFILWISFKLLNRYYCCYSF